MSHRRHNSKASSLPTLYSDEPSAIREQIVEEILDEISADVAGFFSVVRGTDGKRYFTNGTYLGSDRDLIEHWLSYAVRGEAPECPWFPENADPEMLNRFVSVRNFYASKVFRRFAITRDFWIPAEIGDQLRAIIVADNRLIGWLGAVRRGPNERFGPGEQKELQRHFDDWASSLLAARSLDSPQGNAEAYGIFDANGDCRYASPLFEQWANCERLNYLCRLIDAIDSGSSRHPNQVIDGAFIRLVRLDGKDGVRYLCTIQPGRPVDFDPRVFLTPRQRQIADYAVHGATNAEIAETLQLSVHTVKTHVKNIYNRLGVSSRIELNRTLR